MDKNIYWPQYLKHDYYKILGVAHDEVEEEIAKAIKRNRQKYHRDAAHNVGKSEEAKRKLDAIMQDVNNAKDILLDPNLRSEYDRLRAAEPEQEQLRWEQYWHDKQECEKRERKATAAQQAYWKQQEKLIAAKTGKIAAINAVTKDLNSNDYTAESWQALQTAMTNAIAQVHAATTIEAVNTVAVPTVARLVTKQEQARRDKATRERKEKEKREKKRALIFAVILASIPMYAKLAIEVFILQDPPTESALFERAFLIIPMLSFVCLILGKILEHFTDKKKLLPLFSFLLPFLVFILFLFDAGIFPHIYL